MARKICVWHGKSVLERYQCGIPLLMVVAKMASHATFQYNVLVIDIDNTTLGLI